MLGVSSAAAQQPARSSAVARHGGVIPGNSVPEAPQEPRPLVLKRVINIDEHTADISVTWVRLWGHHDRIVNEISDRVYYIIDGEGRFQVGDGAPIEKVTAGDFVYIPRNVPYEFDGQMRYIVMNGPAYRTASDQMLPPVMK
jgi:mannose-6-phosphate isomerase-like protein (cupin superfamily)